MRTRTRCPGRLRLRRKNNAITAPTTATAPITGPTIIATFEEPPELLEALELLEPLVPLFNSFLHYPLVILSRILSKKVTHV